MRKVIIQGYWDGQPIWRYETVEELLLAELDKMEKANTAKKLDIIPDLGDAEAEENIVKNRFEPMSPKDLSDEPY